MYNEKGFLGRLKVFAMFALIPLFMFTAVIMLPFIIGVFMTFTNWTGVEANVGFMGMQNYIEAFTDPDFWSSLIVTFKYVISVVVFTNILAFIIAIFVTSGFKGQNFFRAGFFTPNLIGGVILGMIWQFIFSRVLVNIGKTLGIQLIATSWLADSKMALVSLIIVSVWQMSGYMMMIYIAGLTSLPKSVLEAATIDGAGSIQQLFKIKIPLMIQSFTICLFLTLSRSFMVYDTNLSLTEGGPYNSTELISMHVYSEAFLVRNFGVGQAKAFLLFLIVAIVAIVQVNSTKKLEVEAL